MPLERRVTAHLLTTSFDELSLQERARALIEARTAGLRAGAAVADPDELERARAEHWFNDVVVPAARDGHCTPEQTAAWRERCIGQSALRDPRVQAFFFGWHEAALAALAHLRPRDADGDSAHARWFLGGVDTSEDP